MTDASKECVGAVLVQKQEHGKIRPLVYSSRTILPNENNGDTSDLKSGALVWSSKKLRQFLYGIPPEAYTDYQPLLPFINMGEKNPRVHRMRNILEANHFSLGYRPGKTKWLIRYCVYCCRQPRMI